MQYAQFLVDRGIARYDGGQWHLPEDLRAHGLPSTLGAMFEARVAALSPDARALALGLALARDESRVGLAAGDTFSTCGSRPFPSCSDDGADGLRALHARSTSCCAQACVQQRDAHYVLAQRAMVDALLRTTDEAARERAHLRVADVFDDSYLGRSWPRCASCSARAKSGARASC